MMKKYEHIGVLPLRIPPEKPTMRVETGETFEADLTPEYEGWLLRVGLIRVATASRQPATASKIKPVPSVPSVEPAKVEKE